MGAIIAAIAVVLIVVFAGRIVLRWTLPAETVASIETTTDGIGKLLFQGLIVVIAAWALYWIVPAYF
ncbi:MAG: hypothetical protein EA385_15155 [Salinarimonadaceae bacterium]|nr:MAG: hypothetical protein EA385_15155 [Salinarimonadaceae bacterium]